MQNNWISMHIFYASSPNAMLTTCVDPLVQDLRTQGLIQRYFFIRYWQEGPHIRLRLLPAPGVKPEDIRQIIEPVVSAYLQLRPALYNADTVEAQDVYKRVFIAEYGVVKWQQTYGENGQMPIRANNTFAYINYEPEYHRYGGVAGVELAEWHFEKSSDITIQLLRNTNVHVRSILLGHSLQLSLALCYGLLGEDQKGLAFFDKYMTFWQKGFLRRSDDPAPKFEKSFAQKAVQLQQLLSQSRAAIVEGTLVGLTGVEKEWIAHMRELKARIEALVYAGNLTLGAKDGTSLLAETPATANYFLLSSYVHMANNRLGISIPDEIYISYLLKRALEQKVAQQEFVS